MILKIQLRLMLIDMLIIVFNPFNLRLKGTKKFSNTDLLVHCRSILKLCNFSWKLWETPPP